jgi:putative flippase GtrA
VIWTLARSGIASLITAGAELSSLALLQWCSVPLAVAFALVQIVGIAITFTLNKVWVFQAKNSGKLTTETRRSVPVFLGAFALNTLLPWLGTSELGLSPFVAYLIGQTAVYCVWSFPLNRWWVFPTECPPAQVPADLPRSARA